MAIRYRYPNEDWITLNADSYTLESLGGQCYTGYVVYFSLGLIKAHSIYDSATQSRKWTQIEEFTKEYLFFVTLANHKVTTFPYTRVLRTGYEGITPLITGYNTITMISESLTGATKQYDFNVSDLDAESGGYWVHFCKKNDVTITNIVPLKAESGNCTKCFFKAFLNGALIYEEARSVCPEVELINQSEQCPPGTCQVDCGSVYCCYGSDGIAVSSFAK